MPENLLLFLIARSITVLTPGPGILLNVTESLRYGTSRAWPVYFGTAAGNAVMSVATCAGLGALLKTHPELFLGLQALGGLYLLWLAVKAFRSEPMDLSAAAAGKPVRGSGSLGLFLEGMTLQATNPLLILFLFALFPQFIRMDAPFWTQVAWLTTIFVALTILIHTGYSLIATYARHLLQGSGRAGRWLNRITGAIFLFFSLGVLWRAGAGLLALA